MVTFENTWFVRGSYIEKKETTGGFAFASTGGQLNTLYTFRVLVTTKKNFCRWIDLSDDPWLVFSPNVFAIRGSWSNMENVGGVFASGASYGDKMGSMTFRALNYR